MTEREAFLILSPPTIIFERKNRPPFFLLLVLGKLIRSDATSFVLLLAFLSFSRVASGRALVRFSPSFSSSSSSSSSSSQMSSFFKSFVVSSVARVRGTPYVATFREKCPQKKKVSLSNALLSPPRASRPTTSFSLSLSLSLAVLLKSLGGGGGGGGGPSFRWRRERARF